jgi:hypothetical protein
MCVCVCCVSHEKFINTIERFLPSLYTCLLVQSFSATRSNGKAKAIGLVAQMRDKRFISTLVLLKDVLGILCSTCRLWQESKLDLSAVIQSFDCTLAQVLALKEQPMTYWTERADDYENAITSKVNDHANTVTEQERKRKIKEAREAQQTNDRNDVLEAEAKSRGEEFKRVSFKKGKQKGSLIEALKTFSFKQPKAGMEAWDKTVRQAWLSAVVDHLRARFPPSQIMIAFDTLFNPSRFPDNFSPDYGLAALRDLLSHYGVQRGGKPAVVDAVAAKAEWPSFVFAMCKIAHDWKESNSNSKRCMRPQEMLAVLLKDSFVQLSAPQIVKLAHLFLVWVVHTVPCESGFSYLKLTKDSLRSLLGEDMLNAAMLAMLEGPELDDFPSDECVRVWYPRKSRNLQISNIAACQGGPLQIRYRKQEEAVKNACIIGRNFKGIQLSECETKEGKM